MDEYIPALIIVGIFAALNMSVVLRRWYRAWKLTEMKRQKVAGSTERHIDLRG